MKITVHDVVIDRDTMTKPSKQVWNWELLVLEAKFPDGLVHVNGTTFVERDELPDAATEFSRFERQYGIEEGTNQSIVSIAYDRGEKGIKALAKVIKASVYDAKKEAAKLLKVAKAAAAKAEAAVKAAEKVEAGENKRAVKDAKDRKTAVDIKTNQVSGDPVDPLE